MFDAAAVRAHLPFEALVPALREAFRLGAEVPLRHVHALGQAGTTLLMPAWRIDPADGAGRFGLKTVNVFPGNGARGLPAVHGLYSLFDAATGVPLAVMDGSELTARRTAAAAALAADHLAVAHASQLTLVGAGRVAALVPAAMRCVRPGLAQVTVWNHRSGPAEALAAELRAQGWQARAETSLEAAVRHAHIVSCATLSTAPLVQGAWLAPGAHLDLIGSFTPAMLETDGECFRRADVWVDTDEALAKAGDVLQAVAEGAFDRASTRGTLAALVRGECAGREREDQITLFKAVGTALEDLAAAELVFDTA